MWFKYKRNIYIDGHQNILYIIQDKYSTKKINSYSNIQQDGSDCINVQTFSNTNIGEIRISGVSNKSTILLKFN